MDVYLDESGDSTGFSPGSSKTFNIALLLTNDKVALRRVVKGFCKRMHEAGWPKDVELKAYTLFGAPRKPNIPPSFRFKTSPVSQLEKLLRKLGNLDISIDYISVQKSNLNQNLKEAPPFVLYNYMVGRLIEDIVRQGQDINLYYDQRNCRQGR